MKKHMAIRKRFDFKLLVPIVIVISFAAIGSGLFISNNSSNPAVTASTLYPTDINSDGKVDISDLSQLINKWGMADSLSDVNKDGTVNIFDLSLLISKWGVVPTVPYNLKVEAENFSSQSGVQANTTPDTGGGLYVGWTNPGDWVQYANLNFSSAVTGIDIRLATPVAGSSIEVRLGDSTGALLATVPVPNTGSWETYQTINAQLNTSLNGARTITLVFKNSSATDLLLDVNWINFSNGLSEPVTPPPSAVPPIWLGDYEIGNLSQFELTDWNNLPTAPVITTTQKRSGSYAGTYTIPAYGNRSENVPKLTSFKNGDDYWFSGSTYLENVQLNTTEWQVIMQWKNDGEGSPPVSLAIDNGTYKLTGGWGWPGTNNPTTPKLSAFNLGAATSNTWDDWVFHVVFHENPSIGYIETWRNGVQVGGKYYPAGGTLYPSLNSYMKLGYYRSTNIPVSSSIYHDDWKAGKTYESVKR